MKNIFVILSMLVCFTACKSDKKSVEESSSFFLNAYYQGDYKNAKKYSTYVTHKLIDEKEYYESLNPYSEKKKVKIEIVKVLLKGDDQALVAYKINSKIQNLFLLKKDNAWLVDHSKENPIEQSLLPQEDASGNGYTMQESEEIKMSEVK